MTRLTYIFRGNKYISWELNKKCTESQEIQKSKREVFSETPFSIAIHIDQTLTLHVYGKMEYFKLKDIRWSF